MINLNERDLYWIAGLFEGEGCFTCSAGEPHAQISMCDYDIVERAANMLGANIYTEVPRKEGFKYQFRFVICGMKAADFMLLIYPIMGERRQARIKEVLFTYPKLQKLLQEE
jgi:hypothetical protein